MKVFISHQQSDSEIAECIYDELVCYRVGAYLDVFDTKLISNSKELTNHIRGVVNQSSDILVIMSEHTKKSWWVPFEIGMASHQDLPIVTFLKQDLTLPEYLDYWPRLKSMNDIHKYIQVRKECLQESRKSLNSSVEYFSKRASRTELFYEKLKILL